MSEAAAAPLSGRGILVTRAPHQASELVNLLRQRGATPIQIPTIEIAPPSSYASLDDALDRLNQFDVVAFTSANGVQAFHERASYRSMQAMPQRIAAVGPATERALASVGLRADVLPPVFTAEALAQSLRSEAPGRSFLLVLAEDATPALERGLRDAGARIAVATAYSNRIPGTSVAAIRSAFEDPSRYPDAITFTSASTVNNLIALLQAARLDLPHQVVRASIGPLTSNALSLQQLPPHIEAASATISALVDCLESHFRVAGPKLY